MEPAVELGVLPLVEQPAVEVPEAEGPESPPRNRAGSDPVIAPASRDRSRHRSRASVERVRKRRPAGGTRTLGSLGSAYSLRINPPAGPRSISPRRSSRWCCRRFGLALDHQRSVGEGDVGRPGQRCAAGVEVVGLAAVAVLEVGLGVEQPMPGPARGQGDVHRASSMLMMRYDPPAPLVSRVVDRHARCPFQFHVLRAVGGAPQPASGRCA